MKNRLIIYGTLTILICGLGYLCFRPGPGVTMLNYLYINSGMTGNEIEELLGGPTPGPEGRSFEPGRGVHEHWRGNAGSIRIVYGEGGRITEKEWH